MLTTARHRYLSPAKSIHSTPSHSISLKPNLILYSHLRLDLSSGLPLSCSDTKNQYVLGCSSPIVPHVPSLILCYCMHCKPPVFTVPEFRTGQLNGTLNLPTAELGAICNNLQKFKLAFPSRSAAANSAHVQYAQHTRWGCYPPSLAPHPPIAIQ